MHLPSHNAMKRTFFVILISILLLSAVVLFTACYEEDGLVLSYSTEPEGDPIGEQIREQDPSSEEAKEQDPSSEEAKEQDSSSEEAKEQDSEDEEVGTEQGEETPNSEQGEEEADTSDEEDSADPTEDQDPDETLEEEDRFDRTSEISGYYRYLLTEIEAGEYLVYAEMRQIGSVTVGEDGSVTFSEEYRDRACSLWGDPEEIPLKYYVYFPSIEKMTEIVLRPELSAPALQADLSAEELEALLLPQMPEDDPAPDPEEEGEKCASCGATLSMLSTHQKECALYGEIPAQSAAHDFLSDLKGMPEDLVIHTMTEEAEDYTFKLSYLDGEAYAFLLEKIKNIKTYENVNGQEAHYRAQIKLGNKYFTIAILAVTGAKDTQVSMHLTGYTD